MAAPPDVINGKNKSILPMVPLTDNIVFGRKIAFLCEMAAAVGRSLPSNAKETVDLQHLGQLQVQPAAPRHREGYSGTPLTAAEPVREMRFSSPSSARSPKHLKERRIPAAHRCTRSVKPCKNPPTQCQRGETCEARSKSCFQPPRH